MLSRDFNSFFDRFIENQLMPALQALGMSMDGEEPRIVQVHNTFVARR